MAVLILSVLILVLAILIAKFNGDLAMAKVRNRIIDYSDARQSIWIG